MDITPDKDIVIITPVKKYFFTNSTATTRILIGAAENNDIQLSSSPGLNGCHAVLCFNKGKFGVENINNNQYLKVNGEWVKPQRTQSIKSGARIRFPKNQEIKIFCYKRREIEYSDRLRQFT